MFMILASTNIANAISNKSIESELKEQSCFEWVRSVVIAMDGEINLDNVSAVNYLTAVCEN